MPILVLRHPLGEEVRRIALDKKLGRVYYEYGFDVLSAVPIELFKNEDFLSKRWPQIRALVAEQRESQAKLCSKYALALIYVHSLILL